MLQADGLTVNYDYEPIFSDISFMLMPGDALQVCGQNGAGKTTLLKAVMGLKSLESGQVTWHNLPTKDCIDIFHNEVVYLGHLPAIKLDFTPSENMHFISQLKSQPYLYPVTEVLSIIGLAGYEEVPCRYLSAGQKRRVALTQLFLANIKLWILDEPFTALDKEAVSWLTDVFKRFVTEREGALMVTSHQPLALGDKLQTLTL